MLSREFFYQLEDELTRARYEIDEKYHMGLRENIRQALGGRRSSINVGPNGETYLNLPEQSVQVFATDSIDEIKIKLSNPFKSEAQLSAIDRIREKALKARGIAPAAIKAFESDLDALLAEEAEIERKARAAVDPHKEIIAGVKGELDGLKSAIDILSNGEEPA